MTKTQQYIIFLIIIFSGIFFWLLQSETPSELPGSIGDPLELVLVKDVEGLTIDFYNTFKTLLNNDMGPSPQEEKSLSIIEIDNHSFTGLFQRHQNILIVSRSNNFNIQIKHDLFAKNQIVVLVECRSKEDLILNKESINKLNNTIKQIEKKRLFYSFKKTHNKNLHDKILEQHQISMLIPGGFFLAHNGPDLTWVRRETPKLSQGIVVANINRKMAQTLINTPSKLIDSLIKPHISGPVSGSYMITDGRAKIKKDSLIVNGIKLMKQQSLWHMKNDFMGGVYVSYVLNPGPTRPPVLIYTYLYAPGEEKKIPLLQLEAIVSTIDISKNHN